MKKIIALLLALGCVLALAGCGKESPAPAGTEDGLSAPPAQEPPGQDAVSAAQPEALPEPLPEPPLEPPPEEPEAALPLDPGGLEEPPALLVRNQYDTDQAKASLCGYHWERSLDSEMMSSVIACGPHPLECGFTGQNTLYTAFPAGSLPPLEEGQLPGMILPVYTLDFGGYLPDEVTVVRWPAGEERVDDISFPEGEEVPVELENGWTLFPLGDGEYVYEVQAGWADLGSGSYVFRTIPQVREESAFCAYPRAPGK